MGKIKLPKGRNPGGSGKGKSNLSSSVVMDFKNILGFEEVSSCTLMSVVRGSVKKEKWENGKIVQKKMKSKWAKKKKEKRIPVKEENGIRENQATADNIDIVPGLFAQKKKRKRTNKRKEKRGSVKEGKGISENNAAADNVDENNAAADNVDINKKEGMSSVDSFDTSSTKEGKKSHSKRRKRKKRMKVGGEPRPNKKVCYNKATYHGDSKFSQKKIDVTAWDKVFAPPPVLTALAELGFSQPTEIQKLVLPAAIKGRKDIIGAAETGSGKTLAFGIPIIHGILFDKQREADNPQTLSDDGEQENSDMDEDTPQKFMIDSKECIDSDGIEEIDALNDEAHDDTEDTVSTDEDLDDERNDDEDEAFDSGMFVDQECEAADEMNGLGCVKVIDNANFDFMDEEGSGVPRKPLRALIITPTRELAIQIRSHLAAVLVHTDIDMAVIVGGMASEKQERLLSRGPDIVIGTPGRLWELYEQGNDHLRQIPYLSYLAVDETDRMVELGHFQELTELLKIINSDEKASSKRQTFIFSATLSIVHATPKRLQFKKNAFKMTSELKLQEVAKIVGIKSNKKIVDVTKKFGTAETLTEARIFCSKEEKDVYLFYFLKQYPGRTLVFSNSIDCIRRLQNLFTILNCSPKSLHASMQQKQRLRNLEHFSKSSHALLLATDVAARGLDIPNIQHVIHYQVPRTAETYVHRSGRTARASKEGLSILLIDESELTKYRDLCKTLKRSSELPPFPVDSHIMSQARQRVSLARTIESMEHASRKASADKDWLKKTAQEAGLMLEEEEYDDDEDRAKTMSAVREKRDLANKRASLARLLAKPFVNSNFTEKYPTSCVGLDLPDGKSLDLQQNCDRTIDKSNAALSVMKKEKDEFSALLKKVKVKPPIKKTNNKKNKGFEKRKLKRKKEKAKLEK